MYTTYLTDALTALDNHFHHENVVINEIRPDYLGNPIIFLAECDQNGHPLEYKYNIVTKCLERIKWWRD